MQLEGPQFQVQLLLNEKLNEKLPFSMRLQNWFGFVKISMAQFGSLQYQKSF
jgi:hypothetical protein